MKNYTSLHRPWYFVLGTLSLCTFLVSCSHFNPDNGPIRLNQVGFAPHQEKTATIIVDSLNAAPCEVYILQSADTVWRGVASDTKLNPVSGKPCQLVDFSENAYYPLG